MFGLSNDQIAATSNDGGRLCLDRGSVFRLGGRFDDPAFGLRHDLVGDHDDVAGHETHLSHRRPQDGCDVVSRHNLANAGYGDYLDCAFHANLALRENLMKGGTHIDAGLLGEVQHNVGKSCGRRCFGNQSFCDDNLHIQIPGSVHGVGAVNHEMAEQPGICVCDTGG